MTRVATVGYICALVQSYAMTTKTFGGQTMLSDADFLRYCNNKIEAGWPLDDEELERYWSLVPVLKVSEEEFDALQKLLEDDTI